MHGFAVIVPCVPVDILEALHADCLWRADVLKSSGNPNRGPGRYCIICWQQYRMHELVAVLEWFLEHGHESASSDASSAEYGSAGLPSDILDMLFGECWFLDRLGGDVVDTRAPFTTGACVPHSD